MKFVADMLAYAYALLLLISGVFLLSLFMYSPMFLLFFLAGSLSVGLGAAYLLAWLLNRTGLAVQGVVFALALGLFMIGAYHFWSVPVHSSGCFGDLAGLASNLVGLLAFFCGLICTGALGLAQYSHYQKQENESQITSILSVRPE